MERVQEDPEPDPFEQAWSQVRRGEQIRSDLRRLERILATDMSMSATRQLGNRLAYNWLLRELQRSHDLSHLIPDDGALTNWVAAASPRSQTTPPSGRDSQRASVEVLDIGWSRRRVSS